MSDNDNEKLNTVCTAGKVQVQDKKDPEDENMDSEDELYEDMGDGEEVIGLIPALTLLSRCTRPVCGRMMRLKTSAFRLQLFLPTDAVEEDGDHRFSVTQGGMRFQMSVRWLLPLTDTLKLHKF